MSTPSMIHFLFLRVWLIIAILLLSFPQFIPLLSATASFKEIPAPLTQELPLISFQEYSIQELSREFYWSFPELPQNSSVYLNMLTFEVQNTGDRLKQLNVKIWTDTQSWEGNFPQKDGILTIAHDFSHPCVLSVPLRDLTSQTEYINLSMILVIEYYPKLADIQANFLLHSCKLIRIAALTSSSLYLSPNIGYFSFGSELHSFQFQTYIILNLSSSKIVQVKLNIITSFPVKTVNLGGVSNLNFQIVEQATHSSIIQVALTANITLLRVELRPDSYLTDLTQGIITILPESVLPLTKANEFQNPFLTFPDHPIPSDLMGVLLLIFLLGPPFYHLYHDKKVREQPLIPAKAGKWSR